MKHRLIVLLPVLVFAAIAVLFWKGLSGDPQTLPSALLGRMVPVFNLKAIEGVGVPGVSDADLRQGKVSVVNIWASWCGPCREEHPLLMQLSKRQDIELLGINNKDDPANAARFLGALGQPFARIGADTTGRVAIDWGGYGVPESYIVDGQGIIRYRHVGPLSAEMLATEFSAQIEKANRPLEP